MCICENKDSRECKAMRYGWDNAQELESVQPGFQGCACYCHGENYIPVKTDAQKIEAMEQEIAILRAALEWYLEDDKKAVEYGILESVDKRPAYAVLQKTKDFQEKI